jgi:hypothetical protein
MLKFISRIPKGLLIVIVLLAVFAVIILVFALPTYLPKLGEAFTGGMPQPEGSAINFQEDSAPYRVGLLFEIGEVEVSITDAFVCQSYDHIPPSIFTDVKTIYAEKNTEFVFVGLLVHRPPGQEIILPEVTDISLIYGDIELKGTLPTSFEPFSVPELRERAKWFFFSFGSVPYHDEELDYDNTVYKRMGYIVFSKPGEYAVDDCVVMVLVQGDIPTKVMWSLSGIERGSHSK